MTKNFCDICGEPSIDSLQSETFQQMNKQWRGLKHTSGSISPTDGNWTPTFTFHLVVRAENLTKDNNKDHYPDLCAGCTVMLLERLAAKIKGQS